MICRLCILRHGKTAANQQRLYCGSSDLPLSPAGIAELAELKNTLDYPPSTYRITSGLLRADQTLELIYGQGPDRTVPALAEYHFGEFEMQSYENLKDNADYQSWIIDKTGTVPCPGGENRVQFEQRVLTAFEQILLSECKTYPSIVMVCHGGVITTIMQHCFNENKNFYEWQPQAGHGYILTVEDGLCTSYTAL